MNDKIKSINPYTGETIESYDLYSKETVDSLIENANEAHKSWKNEPISNRVSYLSNLFNVLKQNKRRYAELITLETGKPLKESIAEIDKCIWLSNFYQHNSEDFLADEIIKTEAQESFISYDPLGCILGIMPWNYPFWQVLRFAIPTITSGNAVLVKHASSVSGCSLAIEELFIDSEFPKHLYTSLLISHDKIEDVISNDKIKAISLTGSGPAGKSVGELAGKYLKKSVLELGGSNACIILEDANLDEHMDTIVNARFQNNGQSCIAAKRYIVVEAIYDEFLEKFKNAVENLVVGDPSKLETEISVLAKPEFAKSVKELVDSSVEDGAKVELGNSIKEAHYAPTILTDVTPKMDVFRKETFGPIASIIKAKDAKEALELNVMTPFGLGTMLFSEDVESARHMIDKIEGGAFFINDMVKSDPRLPFGGTKNSGYGRELSKEGMFEFVNKKTVYVK